MKTELVADLSEPLFSLLSRLLPDVPGVRALIESGGVFVAGKRCREALRVVDQGARIVVHLDVASSPAAAASKMVVLYEDRKVIVIDKAPGQHVNETETSAVVSVVEAVTDRGGKEAYTVHRIDRETSGVVLLAKSRVIADALSEEFRERRVKKIYLAIVRGTVADQTITAPIGKDRLRPRSRAVVQASAGGKPAETRVRTIATAGEVSAIEARPVTGRTHQIRVHLSHAGAPIAGDRMYGGPSAVRVGERVIAAERVMLHALSLTLGISGVERTFRAAIPEDMLRFQDAGLSLASTIA